jgi:iron complex transport system substrate-binding protein
MWKALFILCLMAMPGPVLALPRVVSLSLCADPWLLAMAGRGQVVALSSLARDARYSPIAREAAALPAVPADMEAVLPLKPDLVILDGFGQQALAHGLKKAGIRSFRMPMPETAEDVAQLAKVLGGAIGQQSRGEALAAGWRAAWQVPAQKPMPAWLVQEGGHAGMPGWLGDVLQHHGYDAVPAADDAEALLREPKALLRIAYGDDASMARQALMHPALKHLQPVGIDGAQVLCPHPGMMQEGWKP